MPHTAPPVESSRAITKGTDLLACVFFWPRPPGGFDELLSAFLASVRLSNLSNRAMPSADEAGPGLVFTSSEATA